MGGNLSIFIIKNGNIVQLNSIYCVNIILWFNLIMSLYISLYHLSLVESLYKEIPDKDNNCTEHSASVCEARCYIILSFLENSYRVCKILIP